MSTATYPKIDTSWRREGASEASTNFVTASAGADRVLRLDARFLMKCNTVNNGNENRRSYRLFRLLRLIL